MNDTLFQLVALGYAVSGLACLGVAVAGTGGLDATGRVLRAAIGLAAMAYAGYLELSTAGTIWVFPYLLVLPVVLVGRSVREAAARRRDAALPGDEPVGAPAGLVTDPYARPVSDRPE